MPGQHGNATTSVLNQKVADLQKEFADEDVRFVSITIDPSTGTIVVRGVFANPDGQLVPGFFARLRVPGRGPYRALLVPEVAIGSNLAQQPEDSRSTKSEGSFRRISTGRNVRIILIPAWD